MTPLTIPHIPAEVLYAIALALALGLLAFGIWAVRSGRGCTESPETEWPPQPPAERQPGCPARRRMRAGPQMVPGPDGLATLSPLAPQQVAAIARMAQACATTDFRIVGRPSANPYSRNTRAHTVYAIEYAAAWEDLEQKYGRVS